MISNVCTLICIVRRIWITTISNLLCRLDYIIQTLSNEHLYYNFMSKFFNLLRQALKLINSCKLPTLDLVFVFVFFCFLIWLVCYFIQSILACLLCVCERVRFVCIFLFVCLQPLLSNIVVDLQFQHDVGKSICTIKLAFT